MVHYLFLEYNFSWGSMQLGSAGCNEFSNPFSANPIVKQSQTILLKLLQPFMANFQFLHRIYGP